MDALHVPLTAAAALLALAAPRKLNRPDEAGRALRLTGLPSSRWLVRAIGAVELAVGIGVLVDAGEPLWPFSLGVLYTGFALFVVLAVWRHAPLTSCGCFGASDASPTPLHAGVDAGAATVAFLAAADGIRAPVDVIGDGGADAAWLLAGAGVVTLVVYALFTGWPRTRSARSRRRRR
jgi:hypothetical protein